MFWSPFLRALLVSITDGNYEQDRATIFNDLTVNADVPLRIASLSIASIFRCAVDPVTDTLLNHSYRR